MNVQQIADLAWAGQHEQAIAAASAALKLKSMSVDERMTLLDLRSESHLAVGELAQAAADATAMKALAKRDGGAELQTRALCRDALLHIRTGNARSAAGIAARALKAAERSRQPAQIALALSRLAHAQVNSRSDLAAAVRNATRAAALFETLGDTVQLGRAWSVRSNALWASEQAVQSKQAASVALALGRRCGDLYGQGAALNSLALCEADLAQGLRLFGQSLDAYRAAGHVLSQANATGNLAATYGDLGLYRHARRLTLDAVHIAERTGARGSFSLVFAWNLAEWACAVGSLEEARARVAEASALTRAVGDQRFRSLPLQAKGWLALREGRPALAARYLEQAARQATSSEPRLAALTDAASAHLAAGHPAAALAATRRVTDQHRAMRFALLDMVKPSKLWWRHSQALRANGRSTEARKALERAWGQLLGSFLSLSDEGMRRNYLNKRQENRELVLAWLEHARDRKLPRRQREAHLAGKMSLAASFERLVDTGLRLNEIKSERELHEFLVDEVTELSGAERVLLVLETATTPPALHLAGSLVPTGEDERALLETVTPWLLETRRNRAVTLRHSPDAAPRLAQRSSLVVPLIVQRELLGYIYADIDGAFGRFHDGDRDLLAMLASQAAVALANVRFAEGLERKVVERTTELEQRAAELTIINSIQQGIAGSLDFQGIVELVGAKLREVLKSNDIGISWIRPCGTPDQPDRMSIEHGRSLDTPPSTIDSDERGQRSCA